MVVTMTGMDMDMVDGIHLITVLIITVPTGAGIDMDSITGITATLIMLITDLTIVMQDMDTGLPELPTLLR
jgi:hypothetical protein